MKREHNYVTVLETKDTAKRERLQERLQKNDIPFQHLEQRLQVPETELASAQALLEEVQAAGPTQKQTESAEEEQEASPKEEQTASKKESPLKKPPQPEGQFSFAFAGALVGLLTFGLDRATLYVIRPGFVSAEQRLGLSVYLIAGFAFGGAVILLRDSFLFRWSRDPVMLARKLSFAFFSIVFCGAALGGILYVSEWIYQNMSSYAISYQYAPPVDWFRLILPLFLLSFLRVLQEPARLLQPSFAFGFVLLLGTMLSWAYLSGALSGLLPPQKPFQSFFFLLAMAVGAVLGGVTLSLRWVLPWLYRFFSKGRAQQA